MEFFHENHIKNKNQMVFGVMTINRKIILISVLFLGLGIFISYRAFYLNERKHWQISEKAGQEVTGWAAQNLEHQLLQLEASTSYLDQSTVESLKRLGGRYFAYVYKKQDEWSVKWKKLGLLEKEKILTEVNEIDFDKITSEKRTWHFNQDHKLIYVTPASLARSHQLHEGFLVFGLKKDFFKFIQSRESPVVLATEKHEAVEGSFPPELRDKKKIVNDPDELGMKNFQVKKEKQRLIFTSYFSPLSQLWVIHKRSLTSASYPESLFFYYFLISVCFGFLLLLFVTGKSIPFSLVLQKNNKDKIPGKKREDTKTNRDVYGETITQSEKNDLQRQEFFTEDQASGPALSPLTPESSGKGKALSRQPEKQEKEKGEEVLADIEKRVEEAIQGFQLKKFSFRDSQTMAEGPASDSDRSEFQKKSKDLKSGIKTDEHGLFEFDNGQFKIKIRPPKKKDTSVDR